MRSSSCLRRPISCLLSSVSFLLSSISFLLLSVSFVLTACQLAPAPEARQSQSTSPAINPADAWFGFTDDTGSRLLMLAGDALPTGEQVRALQTAVCAEGRELAIRYVGFQKESPQSNGRQSAGNLKHDEGHLFDIQGARAESGDTCLLVPSGYLQRYALVRNEYSESERRARQESYRLVNGQPDFDRTPFQARGEVARAAIARIEREKKRQVRLYWLLHTAGTQQVAIVEFEPVGDDLLVSLVLTDAEQLAFLDMPANRHDESRASCWRVDDSCRLNPEEMDVRAVLGGMGGPLLFYTAWGGEGQVIRLLQVQRGKLVEVKGAYRYQVPL